jgi:hypothetical protein
MRPRYQRQRYHAWQMSSPVLSQRALNRATLARQLLLERAAVKPALAVERLAGLQAQLPRPPYVALWSRLAGFTREQLGAAIHSRALVRGTMMRGTLHLVSARDYRALRPCLQPMLESGARGILGDAYAALDLPALVAESRAFFDREPRTFDELRDHLKAAYPDRNERAMGYAVRCHLPLVQVPVEGSEWAYPGSADFAVAASWLGAPVDGPADPTELVRRYLAAFGPASVADAQNWSGLQGLKPTFEALRPSLRTFRDARGRELFDLPRAPRPDEDTPAPVRYLADYDSAILGHHDRSRLIADEHRPAVVTRNLQIPATFLVDGIVAGTWKAERKKKVATLTLKPFGALAAKVRRALEAEGEALLGFVEPVAETREVVVVAK